MFFLLLLGGGGAGGWYYYQTNMVRRPARNPAVDSTLVAAAPTDSVSAVPDSTHKPDSTAVKPAVPAAPLPTTGTVVVIGLPDGGRVQFDGRPEDATAPISIDPGAHRVTAQARGYENYTTMVTVARGTNVPLTVDMKKLPQKAGTITQRPAAGGGQCESPGDTYNLNNSCWDDRPVANAAPLVPIGDDIEGNPSPSIVQVLVSPEGNVQRVISKGISNDSKFHLLALNFAKTLTFRPAEKDGNPVRAWVEVMLRPTRNK